MGSRQPQKFLQMNGEQIDAAKNVADGAAVLVAGATLAGLLPAVAALFTIVWTGIRIWETETVKGWTGRG